MPPTLHCSTMKYLLLIAVLVNFTVHYCTSLAVQPQKLHSGVLENINKGGVSNAASSILSAKKSAYTDKVFLWTRSYESGMKYELLDTDHNRTISNSHFETGVPTFVIIHGFLSYGTYDWIIDIKNIMLQYQSCNIISVQWLAGSNFAQYYTASSRVPYVGADTAILLAQLSALKGLSFSSVHMIGHSLGAHVAGFAAKNLKGYPSIARITGLDPAGLTYRDTPPSQRLDKTDAAYVDIIHTNGCRGYNPWLDCYGIDNAIGHTDFRPNGGAYQPGCSKYRSQLMSSPHFLNGSLNIHPNTSVTSNGTMLLSAEHSKRLTSMFVAGDVGCDHQMSHDYFVESLRYSTVTTKFLSRPSRGLSRISDYSNTSGCGQYPQYMGFNANPYGVGEYFLTTTSKAPYAELDMGCISGYRFTLYGYSLITAYSAVALVVLVVFTIPIYVAVYRCRKHGVERWRAGPPYNVGQQHASTATVETSQGSDACDDVDRSSQQGLVREEHAAAVDQVNYDAGFVSSAEDDKLLENAKQISSKAVDDELVQDGIQQNSSNAVDDDDELLQDVASQNTSNHQSEAEIKVKVIEL